MGSILCLSTRLRYKICSPKFQINLQFKFQMYVCPPDACKNFKKNLGYFLSVHQTLFFKRVLFTRLCIRVTPNFSKKYGDYILQVTLCFKSCIQFLQYGVYMFAKFSDANFPKLKAYVFVSIWRLCIHLNSTFRKFQNFCIYIFVYG